MKKKKPKPVPTVSDYFRFYDKLKRWHPDELLVIQIGNEYAMFRKDAEAVAKVHLVRIHEKHDGVLWGDTPRYFEREIRPKLEEAGHKLLYAKEVEGGFAIITPEGTLQTESGEGEAARPAAKKRTPRPKPQFVQRMLDLG